MTTSILFVTVYYGHSFVAEEKMRKAATAVLAGIVLMLGISVGYLVESSIPKRPAHHVSGCGNACPHPLTLGLILPGNFIVPTDTPDHFDDEGKYPSRSSILDIRPANAAEAK